MITSRGPTFSNWLKLYNCRGRKDVTEKNLLRKIWGGSQLGLNKYCGI